MNCLGMFLTFVGMPVVRTPILRILTDYVHIYNVKLNQKQSIRNNKFTVGSSNPLCHSFHYQVKCSYLVLSHKSGHF